MKRNYVAMKMKRYWAEHNGKLRAIRRRASIDRWFGREQLSELSIDRLPRDLANFFWINNRQTGRRTPSTLDALWCLLWWRYFIIFLKAQSCRHWVENLTCISTVDVYYLEKRVRETQGAKKNGVHRPL